MGQVESSPSYYKQVQNEDGSFVIVTNEPIKSLQFNSSQSHLISYGIDKQTNPKFKHKTLSSITGVDAKLVCASMVDVGVIPSQNTTVYVASESIEECKFAGIKQTFQECAAKVGPEGLLVFHFSGHGIKVGANEWGLAPVDFDYSRSTYLTAGVLVDWINEVECKAKHILFTLDCCYAGGIGRELTKSVQVQVDVNICVISACTGYETSFVISSLKNSIFAYFLSNAILSCASKDGYLPVKDIFSLCQVCCGSFSSLLIRYRADTGLKPGTMQPQMGVLNLQSAVKELLGQGGDQVDAAAPGRFAFAVALYNRKWPILQLHEKSFAYLDTVASIEDGPLLQLEQKGVLIKRVLDAALCSMMYSLASIELACNPASVSNPNHSITAFMYCVAAIDMVHPGVEFEKTVFIMSWLFYFEVLKENNVNLSGMQSILSELIDTDTRHLPLTREGSHPLAEPTDFPDSPVVSTCTLF